MKIINGARLLMRSLGLLTTLSGCIETSPLVVNSVEQGLSLGGLVLRPDGTPAVGVSINAEHIAQTKSDANGSFRLDLSRSDMNRISALMNYTKPAMVVYFEDATSNLFAVSAPISLTEIGSRDLGVVTLKDPGTYSGMVLRADNGQIIGPASGAEVILGGIRVKVAADGTFTVDRAPAGRIPLMVEAPGLSTSYEEVEIIAAQSRQRENPIVLFAGKDPEGVIMEKPTRALGDLVSVGHATAKHFRVYAARNTRYVRAHHDLKRLESLGQLDRSVIAAKGAPRPISPTPLPSAEPGVSPTDIPWRPITDEFDYDFPANGGQILYYQFTDFAKTRVSKVFQVGTDVDVFKDSQGFVLGDGSGRSPTSAVEVRVAVPQAAITMRFAEDTKDLATAPWRAIDKSFIYNFRAWDDRLALTVGLGGEPIRRELYGQFRDAFGADSRVYHNVVDLILFPSTGIRIGDNSGITRSQLVPVSVDVPPGAAYMRAAEFRDAIKTAIWEPAGPSLAFKFRAEVDPSNQFYFISGPRDICVQFKDPNGFISQAFCDDTMVDLFGSGGGFVINGGNPIGTSRLVTLDITVPPYATEMRIYENARDLPEEPSIFFPMTNSLVAEKAWLQAAPFANYTFLASGPKLLYLQFRGPAGLAGPGFSQAITILPLAESYAGTDFLINGAGDLSSVMAPVLDIELLNVPPTATAMTLSINEPLDILQAKTWMPINLHTIMPINGRGAKTVYLQFRNSDNDRSPVIMHTVHYEPFPQSAVQVTINGGVTQSSDPQIHVGLVYPLHTEGYRLSTSATTLTSLPYQAITNNVDLTLPFTSGIYTTYVQFKGSTGDESLVFSDSIVLDTVNLFPANEIGLVLNAGATTTSDPTVQASITAPSYTSAYRIAADPIALAAAAYQNLSTGPVSFALPAVDGTYTIYIQLKAATGEESAVISDSITLDVP